MKTLKDIQPVFEPSENPRPIIIAGPCSAESEEQVMNTARQLKDAGIRIFRAGIWKPRTRPNAFEGIGSSGLPWLKQVKEETGMLTCTEVANMKHVYEALKYGVDILWIGARTSANPFAMQEIADTLQGVDIPVLIKNPVNPDIELWIGAIERIMAAGIKRVGVIHRGFYSYAKSAYRNDPHWQLPIEIRRRIPNITLIGDPSHMAGKREFILDLSQRALDLQYDGLMIESHCEPENALSDKEQQVTPEHLKYILGKLILREPRVNDQQAITLEEMREQIDKYDQDLLDLFDKRMRISDQIGTFKKTNNITILQTSRWDEIVTQQTNTGLAKGLSEEFVTRIFSAIHQESINRQTRIMNSDEKGN